MPTSHDTARLTALSARRAGERRTAMSPAAGRCSVAHGAGGGRPAIVAVLLAAAIAACGPAGPKSNADQARTAGPSPAPPAAAAVAADEPPAEESIRQALTPRSDDLDGMVARRYVRMLVTFSKTNYFLDKAQQHGLSYDAGKLFEEFLNTRLKTGHLRIHVVFIPTSRDRLFEALAEGRGDIAAANLSITPERLRLGDFAAPFKSDVRQVVVTSRGEAPVQTAADLSGRAVHVRKSSAYYGALMRLNDELKNAGRPPVAIVEASEQLEDEDLLEMVNARLIPATVVDDHVAGLWTQVFPDIQVHDTAVVDADGRIAWALRRNTPKLRALVDDFVAANSRGSFNFNLLYGRYFKDTKFVVNAASENELRKFQQAVQFFRTYGDQYDLPWLLIAAQAYQESQIDQTRRSSAGAVGVMQIKPSTAEAAPIAITGVDRSMERNIHAGVKYLRFIADHYYDDEPMDRLNKALFAMASYNAGPARVSRLRRRASAVGLDGNKWFGNVEVMAARDIGRETVQYVSNIYKYYISYTLISQQANNRTRARGGASSSP
jgi:membrane-bound lytic murein transglycosylase MltF